MTTENQERDLLDEEGENRAVRSFLLQYSCDRSTTVGAMLAHMNRSGWPGTAPAFALEVRPVEHLTKAGAQIWIRHLFSLEPATAPQVAAAPEGWALVPVEPTDAMREACPCHENWADIDADWAAMLAAAPAKLATIPSQEIVTNQELAHTPVANNQCQVAAPTPGHILMPRTLTPALVDAIVRWTDFPLSLWTDMVQAMERVGGVQAGDGWVSVSRADLEAINTAMQHMGDTLNGMDAVDARGVRIATPGFSAISRLLAPIAAERAAGENGNE